MNIKAAWRSMPNYTDDDTGLIIASSGLAQSAAAIMADIGMMMQFNLFKFYSSRDPNVRFGLAVQNLGVAYTGFSKKIIMDDPLPTTATAGFSVSFIKPLTLSVDYTQPLNLQNMSILSLPYISTGLSVQFTSFLQFLAGAGIKGSNPHINAGFEFEVAKIRLNLNYTLDFTTSFAPFNKFSLSAKILLGDKGRSITAQKIDDFYTEGLLYYAEGNWEMAIECWEEALKLNKHFSPAILGIKAAKHRIEMLDMIKNSLKLDQQ
jgi:tetratricopeptide (TPR) repeat protein